MNELNDFFPQTDYSIPTTSNYMKFKEGDNTFRALSSAVVGYEYWRKNKEGKDEPVRSREMWDEMPRDIKYNPDGTPTKINHFWAFVVYNYADKRIQILEITQKGIMKYMMSLVENPKWGKPTGYDLTVNRTGSGFDTEYTTVANPHCAVDSDVAEAYAHKKIDLSKLFTGEDPFSAE